MPHLDIDSRVDRRRALALGGVTAGGLLSASPFSAVAQASGPGARSQAGKLPAKRIQELVGAEGTVSSGVLSIDIARKDVGDSKGPLGVTFTPSFEIDGTLTFQPLGHRLAFFNGWRRAVHNTLKATATPLPQKMPSHPKSPLDDKRLEKILRGKASIGDEGVVTVNVTRRDRIVIDGIHVSPEANISTGIEFKPLAAKGSRAAMGPDFSLTGPRSSAGGAPDARPGLVRELSL